MRTPRAAEPKESEREESHELEMGGTVYRAMRRPADGFDASPTLSDAEYMERLCPPLQDITQMQRDLTPEAIEMEAFMDWVQSESVFAEHHPPFFHQPAPELDHFFRHAFLEGKLRRIRRCVIAGLDANQRLARAAAAVDAD